MIHPLILLHHTFEGPAFFPTILERSGMAERECEDALVEAMGEKLIRPDSVGRHTLTPAGVVYAESLIKLHQQERQAQTTEARV